MPQTIDAPAAPAQPAAPARPTGIDALMAQMDSAALAGKNVDGTEAGATPPPDAAKATDAPAPRSTKIHDPLDVPEKPTGEPLKPVVPPAAPAKPGEPEMSVEDMEKFLKAHPNKKPWKVYESLKTTTSAKVTELETKLKALESKAVESPGDAAKIAAYEKQIEALTGETKTYKERLAETQYDHTPKHQEYLAKIGRIWNRTIKSVTGMQVTEEGENPRNATQEDFELIRHLPAAKRRQAARTMFGEDAGEVLGFVNELESAFEENAEARAEFAKNYDKTNLEREMQSKGLNAKFEQTYRSSLDAIAKHPTHGKWFSPDETDPEGTKLYRDGLAELERVVAEENMSPEEAAQHAAIGRAKAAAMPRVLLAYNRLEAKAKALEEELAKFRSTDPGAKGATAGGGPVASNKPKGIEGAAMAFDSDPSLVR